MHVGTIIARNYLARARVLATSLAETNPDAQLTVLVVDAEAGAFERDEAFRVITPLDLGLSREQLHVLATQYDVVELCTALKPRLLRHLLSESMAALYLDPDVQVFGSLSQAMSLAHEHGIVLTPHCLQPPAPDAYPNADDLARVGAYNLGFIAVSRSAAAFLDWWDERLASDCLVDFKAGLFLDQKWAERATADFPFIAITDPGWNVAWWNLAERKLTAESGRVLVNGVALTFFHFSGFDLPTRELYAREPRKFRAPRDDAVLQALIDSYAERLTTQRTDLWPYGFGATADGRPLTPAVRRAYRRAGDRGPLPPDPFEPATVSAFERWARPVRFADNPLTRALARVVRRLRARAASPAAR